MCCSQWYGIYVTSICDTVGLNVHSGEVYVFDICRSTWIARCLEDKSRLANRQSVEVLNSGIMESRWDERVNYRRGSLGI